MEPMDLDNKYKLPEEILQAFSLKTQNEEDASWVQTYSGERINLFNPDPNTIHIEDIAHALSIQNRYNGHSYAPYSVAQNCVLAADLVPHEAKFWALMHDAPEYILGDIITPIKQHAPVFRELDGFYEDIIKAKFNIFTTEEIENIVYAVDSWMLHEESRQLLKITPDWENFRKHIRTNISCIFDSIEIIPWTYDVAKIRFLNYFKLYSERNNNEK